MSDIPAVHFGEITEDEIDWRLIEDIDPDDEELPVTPDEVLKILGFDPLKEKF